MGKINHFTRETLILIINAYRYFVRPWLGLNCRFEPSCSQYAIEAIRTLGIVKGAYKTVTRLLRCHPGCKGGYDPVLKKNEYFNDINSRAEILMIDYKRIALYGILMAVVYLLWTNWEKDYPQVAAPTRVHQAANNNIPEYNTPTKVESSTTEPTVTQALPLALIHVQTDVLDLQIDSTTGNIVSTKLLKYPVSLEQKNQPFELLNDSPDKGYLAVSNVLVKTNGKPTPGKYVFKAQGTNYSLSPDQNKLVVSLTANQQGVEVTKNLTFKRGDYLINMAVTVNNTSDKPWAGYLNTQLVRINPQQDKSSMFHVGSFIGASYSIPKVKPYKKVNFSEMIKTPLNQQVTGGWVAMQEHYFLSSWIPEPNANNHIYSTVLDDQYTIGIMSPELSLSAGQAKTISSNLYLGPEQPDVLKGIAPGLDLTVDYGWLWFISMFIFWIMKQIYHVVGNWGWSIVIVTLLIKLAFYQLSAASFKSMANMRRLQPKLQSLKERHGEDKAKLSAATIELYRKEKINPLGGCLPIIVQIPVFIALYWVLLESVQLRQAPFMLWIHDLSVPDPYYVLPLLMGLTMFIQQRLNPAPPDPTQAKVMMMLPIVFTLLFLHFPSGLVLYWTVNNGLSILQQWHITRKFGGFDSKQTGKKLTT